MKITETQRKAISTAYRAGHTWIILHDDSVVYQGRCMETVAGLIRTNTAYRGFKMEPTEKC